MSTQKPKGLFGRMFSRGDSDKAPDPEKHAEAARQTEPDSQTEPESQAEPTAPNAQPPANALAEPAQTEAGPATKPEKPKSWFQRLTSGLSKTSGRLTDSITSIFSRRKIDADTLQDLEDVLIQADLGVETSMRIVDAVKAAKFEDGVTPEAVREILATEIATTLEPVAKPLTISGEHKPHVILVVGVNGAGKTTTIGKLASQYVADGKSVLMAAGDTFRAAAIEQLKVWGERTGCKVIARDVGADSAGLAFDALKTAQEDGNDIALIDTAGRLQNKQALMDELTKVIRVMRKVDPTAPHDVLLVLDATTGQNALSQVNVFRDQAGVTGLIMTKLDGTARGGILVAIAAEHTLPVHAIGVGEGIEDLSPFDAQQFARAIANQAPHGAQEA